MKRSDERIIFLDIDGVTMPLSLTYYTETNPGDRIMSNVIIGILNNICRKTGAKIVTNTTHNIDHPGQETIREVLIRNGIEEDHFHSNSKTDYGIDNMHRMRSIRKWLLENGEPDWIAFDDENFTDDPRLILIDRDCGITLKNMWQAMERFGVKKHFLEI